MSASNLDEAFCGFEVKHKNILFLFGLSENNNIDSLRITHFATIFFGSSKNTPKKNKVKDIFSNEISVLLFDLFSTRFLLRSGAFK